jgi:hypothetical protein
MESNIKISTSQEEVWNNIIAIRSSQTKYEDKITYT